MTHWAPKTYTYKLYVIQCHNINKTDLYEISLGKINLDRTNSIPLSDATRLIPLSDVTHQQQELFGPLSQILLPNWTWLIFNIFLSFVTVREPKLWEKTHTWPQYSSLKLIWSPWINQFHVDFDPKWETYNIKRDEKPILGKNSYHGSIHELIQ